MPNGVDRNFVRFISCIKGFRLRYGSWPKQVRLDPSFIDELHEVILEDDFEQISNKLSLIPDESNPYDGLYIAEDNVGNAYDLMAFGHPSGDVDALNWLGIEWPDYGPEFE